MTSPSKSHLSHPPASGVERLITSMISLFERIPYAVTALIARFSIAAVFWKSGQTKIEGLKIDIIERTMSLGVPRLSDSAVDLFRDEYKVPLISPELAAPAAAFAEHLFPVLILVGLATRFSALALLGMTIVIQVFVYPDAYALHGTWAAILLLLMSHGPGAFSIDHIIKNMRKPV